jgi:hypothetical protein
MKTHCTLIFVLLALVVSSQTQIPEGGFENWTPNSSGTYSEPSGNWWTTLNPLASVGAPVTTAPTSDAHSGELAARLETVQWGDFLISGLLSSGEFVFEEPFIKQGRPFSDKPSKFKGWYKYTPVQGDSAGIGAILTRYNTSTQQKDTIADAVIAVSSNITSYTEFVIDFEYTIPDLTPDTIIVVFTSSGDASNLQGQDGSVLIIDDIILEYATGLQDNLMPELSLNAFPSPANDRITLEVNSFQPEDLVFNIYSMDGRLVESIVPEDRKTEVNTVNWKQGKYLVQAYKNDVFVSSTKFIVVH